MRAVTGSGLRTPVVPRFRGSWLQHVLPVASRVSGTGLLRPRGTPAATRAPDPPRTTPGSLRLRSPSAQTSQRSRHRPERPVPPFLGRIPAAAAEPTPAAPGGPGGRGHTCPSSTRSRTPRPCGSVVADLVPSWAVPPAGPAVLGSAGATAGTPGHPG